MWKILGKDALYVEIGEVWKQRMMELADGMGEGGRFRSLLEGREVLYLLNGTTEQHTFMVKFPEEITPEELQFMADQTLAVARSIDFPYISVKGVPQHYSVVFTTEDEPELLGLNRTEGYSAGKIFMQIIQGFVDPKRGNIMF
ncbi:MAG: hypothetical protein RBQ77_02235 [Candidatus Methanomethylophilaceae archaeon]|jgi:hypothetical protein|nr:hypothetical protein [Candidatus Methanomethylophilaceae archaeon]